MRMPMSPNLWTWSSSSTSSGPSKISGWRSSGFPTGMGPKAYRLGNSMIDRISVLLVEDNLGDARLIREMLRDRTGFGSSYLVTHVETLRAAQAQLSLERFDIVLLDLHLPD